MGLSSWLRPLGGVGATTQRCYGWRDSAASFAQGPAGPQIMGRSRRVGSVTGIGCTTGCLRKGEGAL